MASPQEPRPASLLGQLQRWAVERADHVALRLAEEGTALTYAQLWQGIQAATLRLAALGIRQGTRVAYLGWNHPLQLITLFALARLGAIQIPLNWRLAPAELKTILDHAQAEHLLVAQEFTALAQDLSPVRLLMRCIALDFDHPRFFSFAGDAPTGFTPKLADPAQSDDLPLLLVYTSGTTGQPKGALHTQGAMRWNCINSIVAHDFTAADHVLMPLPLFHVGGLCIQTLPALYVGATVTLLSRFDPALYLREVAQQRPTLTLLVPAVLRALLAHPSFAVTDFTCFKLVNAGSSTIPLSLIEAIHAKGAPLCQVYGSTETGPVTIYLPREDARQKPGSAGIVAPHCEVALRDESGKPVAEGGIGEVYVRGKNVMSGYWREPNHPDFVDGWVRTGDLAQRDADGFYWIVGRAKDMLISGGENIYPAELENILADCPLLADYAVVGVPDATWGEVAIAAVVPHAGSTIDAAQVTALFEGRLARYKHPRRVVILDALPKTALGKVQKERLKEVLLREHGS